MYELLWKGRIETMEGTLLLISRNLGILAESKILTIKKEERR